MRRKAQISSTNMIVAPRALCHALHERERDLTATRVSKREEEERRKEFGWKVCVSGEKNVNCEMSGNLSSGAVHRKAKAKTTSH